jgi:hypothetical protein
MLKNLLLLMIHQFYRLFALVYLHKSTNSYKSSTVSPLNTTIYMSTNVNAVSKNTKSIFIQNIIEGSIFYGNQIK